MPTYLSPGVYVEEVDSGSRPIEGVGTAVGGFVGIAERGPFNEPTLVTNWSQFAKSFGDFVPGSYLGHAVYGFFLNGGGSCYVVRVGGNGGAETPAPSATGELSAGGDKRAAAYRAQALDAGPQGNDLHVEVVHGGEGTPEDGFGIVVKRGDAEQERFEGLTTKRGRQSATTVVNTQSKLIRLEEAAGTPSERPAAGDVGLSGGAEAPPAAAPRLKPDDYVGSPADRTGFGGLEAIDPITMVCVPDLMAAFRQGMIDEEGVKAVQLAMIAHCELMGDRVAILDTPPGLNAQQVRDWRVTTAGYDSKYAALYWPWVKVFDPSEGQAVFIPPSGHMAGIWGRNDDSRGVHKAPANEVVRGAVTLETQITKNEHDLLNPVGINCIRSFPGRGIRVWGARTISSDPAWRYLNIRRLFNYLEESILGGTQWAVFEPNDQALWAKMRRTISAFLVNEWRKGALFGLTPDEAFFVRCDDETNPAEGIDAGQVVCEIGVAPVKPAEFVIFRLSQYSGGAALTE
jgi:phage tail sheath protein FI